MSIPVKKEDTDKAVKFKNYLGFNQLTKIEFSAINLKTANVSFLYIVYCLIKKYLCKKLLLKH